MRAITVVRRCRRHPAMTVYIIMIAAYIPSHVHPARIAVIGRHKPCERRHAHRGVEAKVLSRIVHSTGTIEPHTLQI